MGRPGKRYLGVWVAEAAVVKLDSVAFRRGVSRSALAREALSVGMKVLIGERVLAAEVAPVPVIDLSWLPDTPDPLEEVS